MNSEQKNARTQANRASSMRAQAVAQAMRRKEEYLGARVPRELREKVIRRAQELAVPVSILIRNVLEDAFGGHAATAAPAPGVQSKPAFEDVLGWEEITLNRAIACAHCGTGLKAGSRATLGLGGVGGHVVLCGRCKGLI